MTEHHKHLHVYEAASLSLEELRRGLKCYKMAQVLCEWHSG